MKRAVVGLRATRCNGFSGKRWRVVAEGRGLWRPNAEDEISPGEVRIEAFLAPSEEKSGLDVQVDHKTIGHVSKVNVGHARKIKGARYTAGTTYVDEWRAESQGAPYSETRADAVAAEVEHHMNSVDEFMFPPGSYTSSLNGCRCPVLDNNHGRTPPWGYDEEGNGLWIFTEGCPMHWGTA